MFGILDYRAAKLFLILFGIPNYILRIFLFVGVPIFLFVIVFISELAKAAIPL